MAISRYGIRVPPRADEIFDEYRRSGRLIQGPDISRFEAAFEARFGPDSDAGSGYRAIATSYGRMAFYHILRALEFPAGSEIIVPALTFWVIPELARVAGLHVVFADVDPETFTLDPAAFERAITPRTKAVVPTHLYGLPCDMDPIVAIARRHGITIVEDCAHALGATYRGKPVGTFGEGALFSFQTLKPLNAFGGGLALVRDGAVARKVRETVDALPWPDETRVLNRFKVGRAMRTFTRPSIFTMVPFPILWAASWFDWSPDVYLWEKIRPLDPLPSSYTERFPNVQAAIALAGLSMIDQWTEQTRAHAHAMDAALSGVRGVKTPVVPEGRTHVYYQYCVYVPDRDRVVCRAIRRGVDIESLHVDVCTELELFPDLHPQPGPGATESAGVVQIPVYASLTRAQVARIARTVRRVVQ